jgi:hypothetical protein
MNGVLADSRLKSSKVKLTPAALAIAMMWIVALVEPPVTMINLTAFSNASKVIMSFSVWIVLQCEVVRKVDTREEMPLVARM